MTNLSSQPPEQWKNQPQSAAIKASDALVIRVIKQASVSATCCKFTRSTDSDWAQSVGVQHLLLKCAIEGARQPLFCCHEIKM